MLALLNNPIAIASTKFRSFIAVLVVVAFVGVACGTDDGGGNAAAPGSFNIDGETLNWAPAWEQGDAWDITVTSSVEASPETLAMLEAQGEDLASQLPEPQTVKAGTVRIVSTDASGSTGEYVIPLDELQRMLDEQVPEQPGFGSGDIQQFGSMMALLGQLDLDVEFGISANGEVTGVTNLDELAATINEFLGSLFSLAALAGEESPELAQFEMFESLLTDLFQTESAQIGADMMVNLATANMFLMRSGEYATGEPVVHSGNTPTVFGMSTIGTSSYELVGISDGKATVEVDVNPGELDLVALVEGLMAELEPIITEAVGESPVDLGKEAFDAEEQQVMDAVSSMLTQPYTVVLTIDAETGLVTAADWNFEITMTDEMAALIRAEQPELDQANLDDFSMSFTFDAAFSEAAVLAE